MRSTAVMLRELADQVEALERVRNHAAILASMVDEADDDNIRTAVEMLKGAIARAG